MKYDFVNQIWGEDDFKDIFESFDFNLLDSHEFKEDSVREEIIYPLIKLLGYSASSKNKVVRSKTLKHPFYYFGTKKYNVNIIPDYSFEFDGQTKWILDAKRPTENIREGKNVFQAYSYAMHPEIQAEIYGLCNGKEIVIFNVRKHVPILDFKIKDLKKNWNELKDCVSPEMVQNPRIKNYSFDLGLFLLKVGDINIVTEPLEFPADEINMIGKISDNIFSISKPYGVQGFEGNRFMGTFDFNKVKYEELLEILPVSVRGVIQKKLSHSPFHMHDPNPDKSNIKIIAKLGSQIQNNDNESYLPFEVIRFENQ